MASFTSYNSYYEISTKKKLGQTFVYFEKNILVFFSKGPFNIPNSKLGRNCGQNIEDKNKEEIFINQTPNG